MATYSDRIRELREAKGWTQTDLADRLNVTKVAVSQYERGVRKPDINILAALCDVFNVSYDYLLGNEDVTVRYLNSAELKKMDDAPQYYLDPEVARIAQETYDDPMKRPLHDASRGCRPEDVQMAIDLLMRLKRTNPDG